MKIQAYTREIKRVSTCGQHDDDNLWTQSEGRYRNCNISHTRRTWSLVKALIDMLFARTIWFIDWLIRALVLFIEYCPWLYAWECDEAWQCATSVAVVSVILALWSSYSAITCAVVAHNWRKPLRHCTDERSTVVRPKSGNISALVATSKESLPATIASIHHQHRWKITQCDRHHHRRR